LADRLRAFRQGLREIGFVEGDNVNVVYHHADGKYERLPELAADLVRRRVTVIAAGNTISALTAKAATTTIPIAFSVNEDPVRLVWMATLAGRGGNLTEINFRTGEVGKKGLELRRDLLPGEKHVVLLLTPAAPAATESMLKDVEAASRALGQQIRVVHA